MPYPHLFSAAQIGNLKVKNRFVMPPMVRNYADDKGLVTKRYIDHVARIARGGVGLMILEASYIRADGKGFVHELALDHDRVIPGLRLLAKAAQKEGAKIGIQVYHAGRQTSAKTTGKKPVAPSPIPDPTVMEMPRELSVKEIKALVKCYADGALRAKKAGLDFVELHGAHGYLITQFLSPFSNKRRDEYGGTFKKRLRFMEEVFLAVRKAVGEAYPIIVRLSGDELVAGGLHLNDTKLIAKHLQELGANALHISVGNYASYAQGKMIPPMATPDEPILSLAEGVKSVVKIPVIAVAKIRDPKRAEQIIKTKKADFIGIGRTLLADPDYPNKVREDRLGEINKCIACNQGCISRLFAQQDVWCTVNAECGRETEFAKVAKKKKRVLVIGGGPAGLSAAKTAAERGHQVVLYEKSAQLGGQVIAAAELPHRADWASFLESLIHQVKQLGISVHLNETFVPNHILKGQYDAAIVAIGSSATHPNIPGVGQTQVVIARDLVEGRARARGKVVIAGGGCMGSQVAEALALKKLPVTIVELSDAIAMDAPSDDRFLLITRLKKLRVKTIFKHRVTSIGSKTVVIEGPEGIKTIPADTVVLCLGSFPNDGLEQELKSLVKNVLSVGDAHKPARVTEAVMEGSLAALNV